MLKARSLSSGVDTKQGRDGLTQSLLEVKTLLPVSAKDQGIGDPLKHYAFDKNTS